MPDFRVHAPDAPASAPEIRLGADESHHLVVVNRCQRGDPVVAFDGRGREWFCTCEQAVKTGAVLRVNDTRQAAPLAGRLTLAQALPKGSTMDEIVRQATELGVARIVPLLTERTQVHLDGDRADKKVGKWRVTAIEAAKQCGNPWLPEIAPLQSYAAFLAGARDHDLLLLASLHPDAIGLKRALADFAHRHGRAPREVVWLVGPEGDFSPAETAAALSAGGVPITLGPLVLRSDTAAVAALSVLRHELRETAPSASA